MKIEVTINLNNAAFDGDWAGEASRILHNLAERIDLNTQGITLRDINGNPVGRALVSED